MNTKIKKWLEKEIRKCFEMQKIASKSGDDEAGLIWTSRDETLKEVLSELVGGKTR